MAKKLKEDDLITCMRNNAIARGAKPFHLVEIAKISYGSAWRLLHTSSPKPSWRAVKALATAAGYYLEALEDFKAPPLRPRRTRRG